MNKKKKIVRKKTRSRSKFAALKDYVPEDYIKLWSKDYYDLDESHRIKMTDLYINQVKQYEWGLYPKKIKPPYFLTQEDILIKESKIRKENRLKAQLKKESELKLSQEDEEKYKKELDKWEQEKYIVLNKEEQLILENFNLKIQLAQIKEREWKEKKQELIEEQERRAEIFAKKYNINVEQYMVDPIQGIFIRNPEIKFSSK